MILDKRLNQFWIILGCMYLLTACKTDKSVVLVDSESDLNIEADSESEQNKIESYDNLLLAKLDRLKIRSDSTMNASTVTVISEKDSLLYMGVHSTQRENLKLRGKYYHEPWLKVRHSKSGKKGWVYGGAVNFEDQALKTMITNSSPLMKQVYADDLEWDGTVPTGWSTATINDPVKFKLFLIGFKEMIKKDDVDNIAGLVRYPLKDIKNKTEFKANYSRLITDELKTAVADQRLDRIFRNSQGAMMGNGEVWFQNIGGDYKIISIDFKSRSDLTNDLMSKLSGNYVTNSSNGKQSIKAFKIKKFLELTLNYQEGNGFPASRSLGRFLHETSVNGRHSFYQDTKDTVQRRLLFEVQDSSFTLKISNDAALRDLQFIR